MQRKVLFSKGKQETSLPDTKSIIVYLIWDNEQLEDSLAFAHKGCHFEIRRDKPERRNEELAGPSFLFFLLLGHFTLKNVFI